MSGKKVFGLILKKPKTTTKEVSSSVCKVFNNEETEEPEEVPKFDPRKIETWIGSSISQKLSRAELEKAINEDETVCLYDEIFDEMEERKRLADPRRSIADKQPKYADQLLKTAAFRKRERARRMDRKIQKERDEEVEHFSDTEIFITDNYRKKLEEREQEEVLVTLKDKLDEMTSAASKGSMTDFYRGYLMEQRESTSLKTEISSKGIVEKTLEENPEIIDSLLLENMKEKETKDPIDDTDEKILPKPIISKSEEIEKITIVEKPIIKRDKYEIYKKRNDEKSIEEARKRYLERKNVFINQYMIDTKQ